MNSSTLLADGLHGHLLDIADRFNFTVTREINHSGLPTFTVAHRSGQDLVMIGLLHNHAKLWKKSSHASWKNSHIMALIKDYLGHKYEGGGIDFDLFKPDSLDWMEKAIVAIYDDYLSMFKKQ